MFCVFTGDQRHFGFKQRLAVDVLCLRRIGKRADDDIGMPLAQRLERVAIKITRHINPDFREYLAKTTDRARHDFDCR